MDQTLGEISCSERMVRAAINSLELGRTSGLASQHLSMRAFTSGGQTGGIGGRVPRVTLTRMATEGILRDS